jgi:16S rRNA (adenine1518-N6/adenine1519-N6)-dimethyltransferase
VVSQQVIDSIVAAAQVQQGDAVVEVGPGLGSLTDALLSAGAAQHTHAAVQPVSHVRHAETLPCYCSGAVVLAIEKDDALHRHLQHKFQEVSMHAFP